MIRTVADLLESLMAKERQNLPQWNEIKHPGLFGEMYEGLTKDLVQKALFSEMDLRVVGGKIRNAKGNQSGQIDCMVVIGEGEPIPYTQHFIYPVENVLMIVEVKKTLYGAQLNESMDLFHHFWKEVAEITNPRIGLIEDAWRALFQKNLPRRSEAEALPFHEQMIYHTLLTEAVMPLRVVFGYDGYVDEHGLREGFAGYMESIASMPFENRPRFNINTFPNLIVCRKASLIKLDGMPYSGKLDDRGYWWCIGSRRIEPLHVLLELLWTRLAFIFNLSPEIFGEDLEMEAISPLLGAKAEQMGERGGWQYEHLELTSTQLERGPDREEWHPPTLNKAEFVVMNVLCNKGEVDLTEAGLTEFLRGEAETVQSISKSLNEKKLATVVGQRLVLITDGCATAFLPDGRCVAAENKSGRLLRYSMKVAEELRRRKAQNSSGPASENVRPVSQAQTPGRE